MKHALGLEKLRMIEFSHEKFCDSESNSKLRKAQKLGDVMHPDLKHSKLSAREILEESLAETPREFNAEPMEDLDQETHAEEDVAMAGLQWLGKTKRRQSMTNVRDDAQAQPLVKEEQRRNSYALGSASAKMAEVSEPMKYSKQ